MGRNETAWFALTTLLMTTYPAYIHRRDGLRRQRWPSATVAGLTWTSACSLFSRSHTKGFRAVFIVLRLSVAIKFTVLRLVKAFFMAIYSAVQI